MNMMRKINGSAASQNAINRVLGLHTRYAYSSTGFFLDTRLSLIWSSCWQMDDRKSFYGRRQ